MNRLDYAPVTHPLIGMPGGIPLNTQQKILAATDEGDPVFKYPDKGPRLVVPFLLVTAGVVLAIYLVDREFDQRMGKD